MIKRRIGTTAGIVLACAILLGGLFAWTAADASAATKQEAETLAEPDTESTMELAAGTKSAAVTKPGKPKLSSVKSEKVKKLTATWKTVNEADGYILWYQTGDKASKTLTVKAKKTNGKASTKTQSATLTNLVGGQKYKVKVRSYRLKTDGTSSKVKSEWSKTKSAVIAHDKWSDVKDKYALKAKVNQLIFVKYKGNSKATLIVYNKMKDGVEAESLDGGVDSSADPETVTWKKVLSCSAYTGQNGIGKEKEGDRKTPTGVYTLTTAFGVNKNPGSKMDYIKLKDYHYWCGDRDHYNTMIDIRDYPHSCRGEHLITYTKQYAYSMALDYNKKCVYGKGSAIFLHCFGYNPYTLGCIAVSPENMKTILKTCGDNTKICIYKK